MCFLPTCRYHILLLGNIKELLQKLDAFCSNTNTWTVCIHFSSTDSVANLFSRVVNSMILCRGEFISTTLTKEWTEGPASRKKRLSGKKYQKHMLSSLQKTKSSQIDGSIMADRIEEVKRLKSN